MYRSAVLVRTHLMTNALGLYALYWFVVMAVHGGGSWHFFVQGATALADLDDKAGGLHLYAAAPILQIGPLAFLATLILLPAGPTLALFAGQLLGAAVGLVILWQIHRIAVDACPHLDRRIVTLRVTITGIAFLPAWMYLAVGSVHVDDVLAMLCAVLALRFAREHRPVSSGVLLGAAVDAKPWAVIFAGILLMLGSRSAVLRGAVAMGAAIAVAWLPFYLADPATMNAAHFTIVNTRFSALRALGIDDPRTPHWDRPVQALLGMTVCAIAVLRRRWAAALMIAVAARLVLDPGTNRYYVAGLVVGAAIWDVVGSRRRVPWWTLSAYLGLFAARWLPLPPWVHGWSLIAYLGACCLLIARPGERT
ncbi:glycosyltransferase family 87 protein [Cryptosporangium phraense]|uniref:DUF2029 domain-containing protein n=1 Tax=Cryptosporangium phraense TaxID=2593070 RepID=A0A545AVG8_9ACTN|nr:glycosyltransferase 87 family protein [Cryptosporangium phraense]TQS45327.1 DUF2029 domain-containing protein [Cryptosporangium phraense]